MILLVLFILIIRVYFFGCTLEKRKQKMSLCEYTTRVYIDGTVYETCARCGIKWIWIVEDNEPKAIIEEAYGVQKTIFKWVKK